MIPHTIGETCPGIPAGQFHDCLPQRQQTLRLGVFDDLTRDPVLLGEAGVQVFELGQDTAIQISGQAGKLDDRCFADGFDHGGIRLRLRHARLSI